MFPFRFVEFFYANALYFYKRVDGNGEIESVERHRANGATLFFFANICLVFSNYLQAFLNLPALIIQPFFPSQNAGSCAFIFAIAMTLTLSYFFLWRRSSSIEKKFALLENKHTRILVLLGTLYSGGVFILIVLLGSESLDSKPLVDSNPLGWMLLLLVSSYLVQEIVYIVLMKYWLEQKIE